MIVMLLTGAASVLLFGAATWLIMRAGAKPPVPIRTQSRRSEAEYAFKRHCTALRRKGLLCLMAGSVNLLLFLTLGLWTALGGPD